MKLKVVGAHQGESRNCRFLCVLLDDVLALDAGSIASGLTLEEQEKVATIFLSHYHFDHTKDVPVIAYNTLSSPTINIYCLPVVKDVMLAHIFNESIWPKLVEIPTPEKPSIVFIEMDHYQSIEVPGGFKVTAYPTIHSVPSIGFYVEKEGRSVFFTSDTGGHMGPIFERIHPDLIVMECTYPNRLEDWAVAFCHLTPDFVRREVEEFRRIQGYVPRILIAHMNPHYEAEIRAELAPLIAELDGLLEVSYEDMEVTI